MRVLLDECVPRKLKNYFVGHDAKTIPELGWSGKKNGELLALMVQHGFDVFLTVDRNLRFQQNFADVRVGVVVMHAAKNRVEDLSPLVPAVLRSLDSIRPGDVVEISADSHE